MLCSRSIGWAGFIVAALSVSHASCHDVWPYHSSHGSAAIEAATPAGDARRADAATDAEADSVNAASSDAARESATMAADAQSDRSKPNKPDGVLIKPADFEALPLPLDGKPMPIQVDGDVFPADAADGGPFSSDGDADASAVDSGVFPSTDGGACGGKLCLGTCCCGSTCVTDKKVACRAVCL